MNLNQIKQRKKQNTKNNYGNIDLNYLNENQDLNNNTNYFSLDNVCSKKSSQNYQAQFNNTFPNFYSNLSSHFHDLDNAYNLSYDHDNTSIQNEFQSLRLNYTTLNNDNIILREDINKLYELNKHLENSLNEERSHNYELAKQNDILNNERINLYNKINEANKKISEIKSLSLHEAELMNKQNFLEDEINKKDIKCNLILEQNNKLNAEYDLLNEKYLKLQEKNAQDKKELNDIKFEQDEKLLNIEKQMNMLLEEIKNLKKENNELKQENDLYKNKIVNKEKEKEEYFNKYNEQKIINEILTKENAEIKMNLLENEKYLEKKENQELIKEKIRKNNSEHKLRIIQDLQNKIQRYKIRRGNNLNNYNFEDQ